MSRVKNLHIEVNVCVTLWTIDMILSLLHNAALKRPQVGLLLVVLTWDQISSCERWTMTAQQKAQKTLSSLCKAFMFRPSHSTRGNFELGGDPSSRSRAWGRRRGFWNPDSSANEEKADWSISSAVTWQQTFNLRCPNFINFLPWSGKQHVKPTSFTRYTSELHQLNIDIYIKLLTPPQPMLR